jgi:hypothetical protein
MAQDGDWSWMLLPQSTDEWQAGLEKFIDTIFEGTYASETAPCPCSRCCGVVYKIFIQTICYLNLLAPLSVLHFVTRHLMLEPLRVYLICWRALAAQKN